MRPWVLVTCLLVGGSASSAFGLAIRGYVIGNGGASGIPAGNGPYRFYGTAGQAGVQSNSNTGTSACSGFWCFGGPQLVAVDPRGVASLPLEFALGPAIPNPSREGAQFSLALPKPAVVTLSVYDAAGRIVGDPVSRRFVAGHHTLFWRAPEVRAGVYFMRLATDGIPKARRTIVLVR